MHQLNSQTYPDRFSLQLQKGLREDDYPREFLGFKLRVERISLTTWFYVASPLFLNRSLQLSVWLTWIIWKHSIIDFLLILFCNILEIVYFELTEFRITKPLSKDVQRMQLTVRVRIMSRKDDDKNNWENVRRSKTMKRQKPTNSSPAQLYLMFYISYFHHHNQLLDHHSAGHCLHNFENVSEHYVSLFRVELCAKHCELAETIFEQK